MGTLGGDFLSSLPLHEYPPAFPLGADIQGRTLITGRGPTLPHPPQNQIGTPAPLQAFWLSLQRATIHELLWCFFGGEGVRQEVDFHFFFLPGLDLFSFLQTESQVSGPDLPMETSDL